MISRLNHAGVLGVIRKSPKVGNVWINRQDGMPVMVFTIRCAVVLLNVAPSGTSELVTSLSVRWRDVIESAEHHLALDDYQDLSSALAAQGDKRLVRARLEDELQRQIHKLKEESGDVNIQLPGDWKKLEPQALCKLIEEKREAYRSLLYNKIYFFGESVSKDASIEQLEQVLGKLKKEGGGII
ncbi:uncharacterized protein BDV17DRAFT_166949 [Aspergillus undulatus]|uniref:uncharacterized protein n=1 Tax=Aspergillus undulatus TaxID=1810928 RepID=UPI003CCD18E4